MDEGINSLVDTIHQLEAENEKLKFYLSNVRKSLLAAGKLALSARSVTTANTKNLSQIIEKMESDLDAYDNETTHYQITTMDCPVCSSRIVVASDVY